MRFRPYVDLYLESLSRFGHAVQPIAVHSPGHVAATDEQAREEIWPHYREMLTRIGAERGWPPVTRDHFEREAGPAGALCVGSPEYGRADKLACEPSRAGPSRFNARNTAPGTLPHAGADVQRRAVRNRA
jgi:hypothetical protein